MELENIGLIIEIAVAIADIMCFVYFILISKDFFVVTNVTIAIITCFLHISIKRKRKYILGKIILSSVEIKKSDIKKMSHHRCLKGLLC